MGEYTIGIIDDDSSAREVLKAFLEREHYQVIMASSYEETLALAKEKRFDAFLMDIQVGGHSGIEFCRNIRSMESHRHTPIICFTSQDDPQVLLSAFNAGADDFINKPINFVSLIARLKLQLQKTDYFIKLERAQQMLTRYLSPRVASVALEYSGTGTIAAPVECNVAICFTDIRGFTERSEKMDPGQLFSSVSGHLRRQVELVYKYGGYIDKFNGDGIMAVFDGENMVLKSCLCALGILEEASRINPDEEKFPIGIGIHVGRVMMGNIGSLDHLDYSVIGQVVNLAARLCGHAEPETIVVSTAVRDAVGPNAGLDFLDRREVKVRGVSGMVQVFSLAASSSSPNS
ncbi:MAG TPA: adenylate/guanylate cyclase domain-containing protein [Gemmatimonadaceae bacterium]|jgi:class 3 adenylate cyclase|nr:adenylate/guanylate cyclase domain-containing protein [Gemmatimonadaceae bacterium]